MEIGRKHVALVTGFGPFENHIVNASWEAVKQLSKLCTHSAELADIEVIIKEIPVSYEDVITLIPKLWEEYKPIVVLHVGVSRYAKCLTLECLARNNGYTRQDVYDKCPDESNIKANVYETKIDVKKICDTLNENSKKTKCNACISLDAGRYLCEYTFHKSLQISSKQTLFVHVPDFYEYPSSQTARGLYEILCCMIKDVKEKGQ